MLLRHTNESLAALQQGIDAGCVGLQPAADDGDLAGTPPGPSAIVPADSLTHGPAPSHQHQIIHIVGCPLAASVMAGAGALEIAVHGWDISRTCGHRQPIPRALAIDLLAIAPLLVPGTGRHPLFAAPVTVAPTAGPSDRLAAFLGRTPQA